jgi:hypothetical protein
MRQGPATIRRRIIEMRHLNQSRHVDGQSLRLPGRLQWTFEKQGR